jgi:hypothetical protein
LEWVIKNLPASSNINLFPETPEVYKALKMSNDILAQRLDTQMYCSVPQWLPLIDTMCECGSSVTVQETYHGLDSTCLKMSSLAIRETQEAMEDGVSIREYGCPISTAGMGTWRETAPI